MIKLQIVIAMLTTALSPLSYAEYPNLALSTFTANGDKVSETDNAVKLAIDNNRFIPLRYNDEFKRSGSALFKEVEQLGEFELRAYLNSSLVRGIQQIAGEFACATYRHQLKQPQASSCNGYKATTGELEGKPFQSGQYVAERLTTSIDNLSKPSRSYDLYLPSASEKPLDSFWGAAHEFGSFKANGFNEKSIVLTVYIDAFKMAEEGERSEVITKKQAVIVLLPPTAELARKKSESDARDFAINKAMVLVPFY
ncbi:hypothetical protein [uncultured Vibrio sp.]|uniref:hypothetical protein n=1 Tax=uncultured Vibrio sp. TaxID=114054 RepID=UPI0025FB0E9D|nr:hypothetical protein [uncultured Vibrio sp.]